MLLTDEQQQTLARRAHWYFDCYFGPPGDFCTYVGCGIGDLDKLISRLNNNAQYNFVMNQRFLCDVGGQYSDWRNFDIEDVLAIRDYYLQFHGNVNKPNYYDPGASAAISVEIANQP